MADIYVSCAKSLDFWTAEADISVKLESVASIQVVKSDTSQPQIKIILKNGKELPGLRPKSSYMAGKILIGGTVADFSGSLLWDRLHEVQHVPWQQPEETSVPPARYLGVMFKNVPFPLPVRRIHSYSKGKFDTGYVSGYIFGIRGSGSKFELDEYRPESFNEVRLKISGLQMTLPLARISLLSLTDKVLTLRNSQGIAFESAELMPTPRIDGNMASAETSIGNWVFDLQELEALEFTEVEPSWSLLPDEKLVEYEVTDSAKNTYRTKRLDTSFVARHRDLKMRFLAGQLRDNFIVYKERGGWDHRDSPQQRTNVVPIDNVNGSKALLLLDLRYAHDLKNNSGDITIDLGEQRALTGSIETSVTWKFNDELTGKTIELSRWGLVSVHRIVKKKLEY